MIRLKQTSQTHPSSYAAAIAQHAVLRNTYLLLSLTLLFSAGMAWVALATNAHVMPIAIYLIGFFGLYFLTLATRNSGWGILSTFALTGFLGYALGPIINIFLHRYANGEQIVMTALGTTGIIFLALSAYVLVSRKDFSYLGGFILIAALTAFVGGLVGVFFHLPLLQLIISGAFALISSAYILYTTSQIVNGGETNYVLATVSLYIALFNLFSSLLNIFGAFGGRN